jgi:hypothetical protein
VFYSKNKCEKSVRLIGFVISVYHDAHPLHVKVGLRGGKVDVRKNISTLDDE